MVDDVQSALEENRLGSVRQAFLGANNLISSLEKETRMVAILLKMVKRRDQLSASITDAFAAQWDRLVSVQVNDEGASLMVTEEVNGKLAGYGADGRSYKHHLRLASVGHL
jgi:hypothetical protein